MLWKYYTSCYFSENNYHFHFHSGRRVSIGELVFSQNIVGFVMVGENGKACQNDSQVKKPQYILQNIRQLDEIKNQKTLDLIFNWKPDLDQKCKFVVVIFNLWVVRCFPVFHSLLSWMPVALGWQKKESEYICAVPSRPLETIYINRRKIVRICKTMKQADKLVFTFKFSFCPPPPPTPSKIQMIFIWFLNLEMFSSDWMCSRSMKINFKVYFSDKEENKLAHI